MRFARSSEQIDDEETKERVRIGDLADLAARLSVGARERVSRVRRSLVQNWPTSFNDALPILLPFFKVRIKGRRISVTRQKRCPYTGVYSVIWQSANLIRSSDLLSASRNYRLLLLGSLERFLSKMYFLTSLALT